MSAGRLFRAAGVKVILFDATETLVSIPRGVGAHYAEVAAQLGATVEETHWQQAFKKEFRAMPARPSTGEHREDDDRGWWQELVMRVLAECVPVAQWPQFPRAEYFERVYTLFADPGVWALYPDVLPALEALGSQFRLGVISNFDVRLHGILAGLGIADRFEHVVISSEVGADKPLPLIFQIAMRRFGVAAADALHVGDHPELDWRAAERAGLGWYELQRPQNTLADLVAALSAS